MIAVPATAYQYSFYTIIPDGWYYDHTINTKKIPYIVDSGTTLCYLPPSKCFRDSAYHFSRTLTMHVPHR